MRLVLGSDRNHNDSDNAQEEAPPESAVPAAVVVNRLADKAADHTINKRDDNTR